MTTLTKMVTSTFFRILTCALLFFNLTTYIYANPTSDEEAQTTSQDSQAASEESSIKPDEKSGVIYFRVTDFETGFSVPATLLVLGAEEGHYGPQHFRTDDYGRLGLKLPPGFYLYEVSATGYKSLRSYTQVVSGAISTGGAVLAPLSPPEEDRSTGIESKRRAGYTRVYGYVSSSITGKPLSNVRVRIENAQIEGATNARGFFEFYVLSPPGEEIGGLILPGMETMTVELTGYKKYVARNVELPAGLESGWKLEIHPGNGAEEEDHMHKLRRPPSETGVTEAGEEPQSVQPGPPLPPEIWERIRKWIDRPAKGLSIHEEISPQVASPLAVTIPSQIVVGSNCPSGTNGKYKCTTVMPPYSLESYVQQGLQLEWISGWDTNSLKAGAVAYRSYGAWHAASPLCPYVGAHSGDCTQIYDICNTTACQKFTPTNKPKSDTKAATTATEGVVLTSNGTSAFYAEYAAERARPSSPSPESFSALSTTR